MTQADEGAARLLQEQAHLQYRQVVDERDKLREVNTDLLAALHELAEYTDGRDGLWPDAIERARAAIAKAQP